MNVYEVGGKLGEHRSFWNTDSAKSLQTCSLIAFCGSFWNTDRLQLAQASILRLFFHKNHQSGSGAIRLLQGPFGFDLGIHFFRVSVVFA